MRLFQIPCAALVAGLAVLLSGCAGETPTSPSSGGGGGGNGGGSGSCTTLIAMSATTQSPFVGSGAIVRATVTRAGVPVPDGGSVQFTTDFGFFGENGFRTISKTTAGGVADVTVFSFDVGTARVKAVFDCANAQINLNFGGVPDTGPFISSLTPTTGSCAGGDTVTIQGGRFGTGTNVDVFFGGAKGSIQGAVTDTKIVVTTPARTLKDPTVPETVDVIVRVNGVSSAPKSFTFACIPVNQRIFISSISPTEGTSAGGDIVTINGGHFGSNIATTRVTFCGRPAQITAQADQQIIVTTPASPLELEVCDVVVTRDLGLVSEQSATAPQQFTYHLVLTPTIFSVSPRTGPNDASTRVTIFGTGFQFPMQVFMTGGPCGQQLVEAAVSDISPTTIVFKTPIATNNVCLMNALVDVVIKNPSTGKGFPQPGGSCAACFKYYSCPTIGTASPSSADGTVATNVVISGANFEEPITANFNTTSGLVALNVTSVSSNAIVVTMPPLSQILGGSPACTDVSGNITIAFLSLTCAPIAVPFTYHLNPPFASSAAPNNLSQDGSLFPTTGVPATIAVTGGNFKNPMTVQLIKDGNVVANTPVNNANVANATSLTFVAPAVLNSSLNQQNCLLGGTVSGVKFVATSFGIRLKSALTNCTVDLPNVLVYNPIDTTCRAALTITTPVLPAGTATVAYGPVTMAAAGGTGLGYTWSASGLPAAITINPGTGVISGIPAVPGISAVTVTVTDSATNTASRTYSLVIN